MASILAIVEKEMIRLVRPCWRTMILLRASSSLNSFIPSSIKLKPGKQILNLSAMPSFSEHFSMNYSILFFQSSIFSQQSKHLVQNTKKTNKKFENRKWLGTMAWFQTILKSHCIRYVYHIALLLQLSENLTGIWKQAWRMGNTFKTAGGEHTGLREKFLYHLDNLSSWWFSF